MKISRFLLTICLFGVAASVRATSVIPPSFDQLVGQADIIFQGTVTDVRSQWAGEGAQRHIVSYVSFSVEDALKGAPGQTYVMRMFGGTVGEDSMGISDGPVFHVGDREILFVENNGTQVVPLVGLMNGRFHLQRDSSGSEIVTRNENQPVKNLQRLASETESVSQMDAALPNMTSDAFKSAVREKLQTK
jgi:hypothetical protein